MTFKYDDEAINQVFEIFLIAECGIVLPTSHTHLLKPEISANNENS
jgi:hypothetical protein